MVFRLVVKGSVVGSGVFGVGAELLTPKGRGIGGGVRGVKAYSLCASRVSAKVEWQVWDCRRFECEWIAPGSRALGGWNASDGARVEVWL